MYNGKDITMGQQQNCFNDRKCLDVLDIRIREKADIEAFALVQTLGLLEALQRRIMTTAHCKKSVFSNTMIKTLQNVHVDNRILQLIYKGSRIKSTNDQFSDPLKSSIEEMYEEALSLLQELVEKQK